MPKRFLLAPVLLLAACGDGTGPPDAIGGPHIEAPSVVQAIAHPSGPYCVLTWELVGEAEWDRGTVLFRNASGAMVGTNVLDVPVVLHGEVTAPLAGWETANLSIPWRTSEAEGTASHTYRCEG